jgi:hypothetical protein
VVAAGNAIQAQQLAGHLEAGDLHAAVLGDRQVLKKPVRTAYSAWKRSDERNSGSPRATTRR